MDDSSASHQLADLSSDRTLVLALEVDRDGARLVGFTLKARQFVSRRELPSPKTYVEGEPAQIEVVLIGSGGGRYTQRIGVAGLCLAHGPDVPPEIEGDTIRLHRESFIVEEPEIAGFDQIEMAYYTGQDVAPFRTMLGAATLDATRYTSAGGKVRYEDLAIARPLPTTTRSALTLGTIHFPEEFGDSDIFTVYGNEAETSKRINIVIVPDGYTYAEKAIMQGHAQSVVDAFRARTPYKEHDRFINYILVYAYSTEDGTDQCDCSIVRDTAMSTRFLMSNPTCGHSDNRCLYYGPGCDTDTSAHIATTELRAPADDKTIVMVNTTRYGGCGGERAVYSAASGSATEIAIHELGHALANLDDEYGGNPSCGAGSGINTSMDSVNGNWPEWIPELGAPRQGARYYDMCIYRPADSCEMGTLGYDFCPVCRQRWALTFFGHPRVNPTAPLETQSPGAQVSTNVGTPVTFSIGTRLASGPGVTNDIIWQLQGPGFPVATTVATGTDNYTRTFSPPGTYTVTSQVVADTNFIKPSKNGANADTASWTVSACDPTGALAAWNNGPICANATLQLFAATFLEGTYQWTGPRGFHSSEQNPSIPNAASSASGTYRVTVTAPSCSFTATTDATVVGSGSACNDANACTQLDTCQAGVCAGTSISCDDSNQCTADTCDPAAGCAHIPVVCSASDQCHQPGTCNPATGTCSNPAKADGTSCNDGSLCTQTDSCQGGSCVGSNPVICATIDQCHDSAVCNPSTGSCPPPKADGTACDDAEACTVGDACRSGVCVSASSFSQAQGSPVVAGSGPRALAQGDFDRDGKVDLAVANDGSNNVSILLGDGAGRFTQPADSPVGAGSHPNSVAVGDFDLDGNPDLAVANYGSINVTILLGNGTGGFIQPVSSPVTAGSGPRSVAVADFDLDGKPDLAVANGLSNNVTILLGDGTGRFVQAAGSPVGAGSLPNFIAVGDLNLDGKPDLAVANYGSINVTILLGDGTGRFIQPPGSPMSAGSGPRAVAVGDLNRDGKPDLAVANGNANSVTILLGNGTGMFVQPGGSPVGVGSHPYCVTPEDFNLDGKPDLAVANEAADSVTILLGDGSGKFNQPVGSPVGAGSFPNFVGVGEFNLDGKPDLAVANFGSNNVTILLDIPVLAPDGTTCSDGNDCTVGDHCSAGACSGMPVNGPPEVQSVAAAADKVTFSWSAVAGATRYDVARGNTSAFPVGPGGGDEVCFDNLSISSVSDSTIPTPGAGFWYLSRAENACGNGTYGTQGSHGTPGAPRITTTCP